MILLKDSPKQLGYFMPPEWHPHEATWLSWPNNNETWIEDIQKVEATFLEMIKVLTEGEKVFLLVDDVDEESRVKKLLEENQIDLSNVKFFQVKTTDVWIRDYGPNFIIKKDENTLSYNRWKFNAWGNKYDDLKLDDEVQGALSSELPNIHFEPSIVLEGGSIDVNGEGVCLTTKQCLLNPNRNPHLTQSQIENYLHDYLGVEKVIWLDDGVEGDDTDGHIDDIARFVDKDVIVAVLEENEEDINRKPLLNNFNILKSETNIDGSSFKVINLPMPRAIFYKEQRLPASYANFYIANSAVLVPIFNDPNDKIALGILDNLFPDKRVVGIDCEVMVRGFGTIHCSTQQQPKV